MKPFKNKLLWKLFTSIIMIPVSILLGGIITALILGILGIHYHIFGGLLLVLGIIIIHCITMYKIFAE